MTSARLGAPPLPGGRAHPPRDVSPSHGSVSASRTFGISCESGCLPPKRLSLRTCKVHLRATKMLAFRHCVHVVCPIYVATAQPEGDTTTGKTAWDGAKNNKVVFLRLWAMRLSTLHSLPYCLKFPSCHRM